MRGPAPPAGLLPFSERDVDIRSSCRAPSPRGLGAGAGRRDRRPPPHRSASRRPEATTACRTVPGVSGAAFFDLDRTLLAGASGEAFSAAMKAAGFTSRSLPGERLVYGLFNRIGETLPSMALARQAARLAKGRSRDIPHGRRRGGRRWAGGDGPAVRRTDSSPSTAPPVARSCWRRRRPTTSSSRSPTASGSTTSSPPATASTPTAPTTARSSARSCGPPASWRPCGTGPPTTASTSARATPTPTASTTRRCSSAVGTPIVVNPDPRMVLMATTRRWPILNLDVSPGVVKIPVLGIELQRLALQLSRPSLMPYARFDIDGVEHIPAAGAAILVANHRSYFDSAAMSMAIARSGRTVRFLGKKEVFDAPVDRPAGDGDGRHPGRPGHRVRRAAAGRRRRPRRGRGRGDHAAGHDPARAGVLRPRARRAAGARPGWRR